MRRIGSQLNIDEMALDESSMELELIKLQANYRHLSEYYESYKEETERNLKKQKWVTHSPSRRVQKNPGFWKSPTHQVLGFYWVLGFIGFIGFERAVGKLVGWFSSSAKLLFRLASTLDYYLKFRKVITYWSLEAVNIKKSFITTGMTNWNWIKYDVGICCFFQRVLPPKPVDFLVLPGCLNTGRNNQICCRHHYHHCHLFVKHVSW